LIPAPLARQQHLHGWNRFWQLGHAHSRRSRIALAFVYGRVVRKIVGGAPSQRGFHREQPQASLFLPVRHTRQRDAKLQQGRGCPRAATAPRACRVRSSCRHGVESDCSGERRHRAPKRASRLRGAETPEGKAVAGALGPPSTSAPSDVHLGRLIVRSSEFAFQMSGSQRADGGSKIRVS
jgi:hypothetical protein